MPLKRGPASEDERELVSHKRYTLSPAEIGKLINRSADFVTKLINEDQYSKLPPEKTAIRDALRTSEKWKRLTQEITPEEMRFFEEEYVKLMAQFQGDVLASETTQIFDCIKFGIMKTRNMIRRRKAIEDISRLERMQEQHLERFRDASKMKADDKVFLTNLENQIQAARVAEQNHTSEFVKLQEQENALMKSLKSTRDQRVKDVNSGKETILVLLKKIQKDERVRHQEGRDMVLADLAAKKEHKKLGRLHEYENGETDRPILSPDTVGDDDEDFDSGAVPERAAGDGQDGD